MEEIIRAVHRLVSHCHETDLRAGEIALQVKAFAIKADGLRSVLELMMEGEDHFLQVVL